jgi:hypothetical protein
MLDLLDPRGYDAAAMAEPRSSRALGRLALASLGIAVAALLVLAAGGSSGVVVAVFWAAEALAALMALIVVFWRGQTMPVWGRLVGGATLLGQAAFVFVLARGLSELT